MPNTVLGKVSCVPRGNYSASATYTVLDIAGYQGGSYMALKTVTGVTPSNDGINWMQLSGPGLPGEQGEQGEPGEAAGFGQATATVDESTGTPSVDVTTSGPDTAKVFNFAFSGLKGETGAKGDTGAKGNTGATGPQGVSVTDAEINESGRLIITLSAGEPIDAGNAVGPTGAKGDTGATGPEGASVDRIERTAGTGAPGTTDTYTVYLTDGSTGGTFNVYNGSNGTGSGDFMADGSVPMSGALQMGGNRITNVGAPTANTDAVRQADLKAVSDEIDHILDGTTPVAIPAATTAKIGGVIVGDGLSVETNGTISADSQLPTGGTAGQMLYKSAEGVEWGDKPVMYVNITGDDEAAIADKTFSEITEAVQNGFAVYAKASNSDGTFVIPLVRHSEQRLLFGALIVDRLAFATFTAQGVQLLSAALNATNIEFVPGAGITSGNVQDAIEEVQSHIPTDYIPTSQKGAASGVAELDNTGRVPSSQLPSYVDDVLEYDTLSSFPPTGEDGKIYIAEDTNLQYRWSGSQYIEISPSLALGETSSTAYRGDRGKTAYDHSQITTGNPHGTTAADVGAVPTTRTVNGHALSDNISLTAGDVGARPASWTPTAADVGAVPTSRTVNGKALSSDISLAAADVGAATPADVNAAKPVLRTATLTASGWSGNSQTVTVSGVVTDTNAQLIYVSPADKASATAWGEAGVFCSGQGANSLTFVCDSTPSANIVVNIAVQEAQT